MHYLPYKKLIVNRERSFFCDCDKKITTETFLLQVRKKMKLKLILCFTIEIIMISYVLES